MTNLKAFTACLLLCAHVSALKVIPGERTTNPSIEDFHNKFARPGTEARPVVLAGAASAWPAMDWTLDTLKTKCGAQVLERKCQGNAQVLRAYNANATGMMWGGMMEVDGNKLGVNTFGNFVDAAHKNAGLYLHDAGIDSLCPELLDDLRAPKYFQLDLQKQLPDEVRNRHKCNTSDNGGPTHPSLFLGEAKSVTGLHIDSRATRFWMAVLSGTKTFRLVNPRDIKSLAPLYSRNPNGILLPVDLFDPDEGKVPSLRSLEVLEFTLHPGDIIFIPEGWPHQVRNEERSIAVSYNFIDPDTLAGHMQYLQNSASYLQPGSTDQTISELQLIWMKMSKDFPMITRRYSYSDVPWREFFRMQRTNVTAKSLFDNMTAEQSLESLKMMEQHKAAQGPDKTSVEAGPGNAAGPLSDLDNDDDDDDEDAGPLPYDVSDGYGGFSAEDL